VGGEKMNKYETMFILNPDLEDEATEKMIAKVEDTINENEGEIVNMDQWGTRELAYEIEDHGAGYYTVINFEGSAATVNELERIYRINDSVLRFITLRDE